MRFSSLPRDGKLSITHRRLSSLVQLWFIHILASDLKTDNGVRPKTNDGYEGEVRLQLHSDSLNGHIRVIRRPFGVEGDLAK